MKDLEERLKKRELCGELRSLRRHENLIDFSSNDSLGLKNSIEFKEACLNSLHLNKSSFGSSGSRLVISNPPIAEALEEKIARFHGFEEALLFSTGYMANLGLLQALPEENDTLFFDYRAHSSIYDGIKLSKAKKFPFRIDRLELLEKKLKNHQGGISYIVVEAIHSTEGTLAPLADLASLAERYSARLIVDEAHSAGVRGTSGEGLIHELGLQKHVFATVITYGKAFGVFGAAVVGHAPLKKTLLNFSKTTLFTTALPESCLYAIDTSYRFIPTLNEARKRLQALIEQLAQISSQKVDSHIFPLRIKGAPLAKEKEMLLRQKGFDIRAQVYPTVPKGRERLRLCLHAFNQVNDIKRLFEEGIL